MKAQLSREELQQIADTDHVQCGDASAMSRMLLSGMDSEPVGYFRRYDPDFDALIAQCDKGAQGSFPLYLHAQSEPIEANIARDAQRYRFLRDKDAFGDDDEPGLASWDELIEFDMNEFDAAIDARMAHPSVDFITLDNALQKHERRRCKDRNCNKQIFGYSVDGLCEDCYAAVSQRPAPVAVPDSELTDDVLDEIISGAKSSMEQYLALSLKAERAAMLAKPVTGWIKCSELLPPEEYQPDGGAICYLVWHKNKVDCGPQYGISNVVFLRKHWEKWYTHWMPLPAAPEQES